ncbi:SAM-dependent methyltransferase [Yoonia sediminilitoris]|uniref:Methyltransferase family protein n=1 Tax=Yoonia sediminilitoris TaxID=1286148 RepID=A0A2T6KR54_9RHOB|nr:class I SAM-dependent methyltransferase [Yoonia sediminilitoris]PUB19041.1 methyltransferase family protein [Yoonia sediminilitoris]RCW99209.1 methyltransferase family protein [Yoonia sediminilitoris]
MWEERYRGKDGYLFGTAPAAVLAENPWLAIPGATALCVADGEGRNSVHLAQQGMSVTSFDTSTTAVGRANALATTAGVSVETHVSDWDSWDWSRQFDMVVAIFIQFADPAFRLRQFANISTALRPGGRLLLHGYRPEQIGRGTGGPPYAENMYTEAELRESFPNWTVERCAIYERDQQSGTAHVGQAALIDFVARKP